MATRPLGWAQETRNDKREKQSTSGFAIAVCPCFTLRAEGTSGATTYPFIDMALETYVTSTPCQTESIGNSRSFDANLPVRLIRAIMRND